MPRKKRDAGMPAAKRGRKALPIKVDIEGARDRRIIRRFQDTATREREMEKLRLAGELDDGIKWMSFDSVAQEYFTRLERSRKSAKRIAGHRSYYARFLKERFHDRSVRAATAHVIREVYADIDGKEARTVWTRVDWLLRGIIKLAVSRGYILPADNPYKMIGRRKKDVTPLVARQQARSREIPLPTLAECLALLDRSIGWLRIVLHLILLAGLRSGEVRALRWEHVVLDEANRVVWIKVKVAIKEDGFEGPPKTSAGVREICARGRLYDFMKELHPGVDGLGLQVVTIDGGVLKKDAIYNELRPLQAEIGIGRAERRNGRLLYPGTYRPHLLRHAAAAWWIWRRVPDLLIRKWLGHQHIQTTLDTYGYIIDARARSDADWPSGPQPEGDEIDEKGDNE